jgi:hypothetical protein
MNGWMDRWMNGRKNGEKGNSKRDATCLISETIRSTSFLGLILMCWSLQRLPNVHQPFDEYDVQIGMVLRLHLPPVDRQLDEKGGGPACSLQTVALDALHQPVCGNKMRQSIQINSAQTAGQRG